VGIRTGYFNIKLCTFLLTYHKIALKLKNSNKFTIFEEPEYQTEIAMLFNLRGKDLPNGIHKIVVSIAFSYFANALKSKQVAAITNNNDILVDNDDEMQVDNANDTEVLEDETEIDTTKRIKKKSKKLIEDESSQNILGENIPTKVIKPNRDKQRNSTLGNADNSILFQPITDEERNLIYYPGAAKYDASMSSTIKAWKNILDIRKIFILTSKIRTSLENSIFATSNRERIDYNKVFTQTNSAYNNSNKLLMMWSLDSQLTSKREPLILQRSKLVALLMRFLLYLIRRKTISSASKIPDFFSHLIQCNTDDEVIAELNILKKDTNLPLIWILDSYLQEDWKHSYYKQLLELKSIDDNGLSDIDEILLNLFFYEKLPEDRSYHIEQFIQLLHYELYGIGQIDEAANQHSGILHRCIL